MGIRIDLRNRLTATSDEGVVLELETCVTV